MHNQRDKVHQDDLHNRTRDNYRANECHIIIGLAEKTSSVVLMGCSYNGNYIGLLNRL